MKISVEKIKRVVAVVIMTCLFLPLAQCSRKTDPSRRPSVSSSAPPSVTYLVVAKMLTLKQPSSLLTLLLFAWPVAACAIRWRANTRKTLAIMNLAEIVLSTLSLVCVAIIVAVWAEGISYGGVLALTAFALHLLLSCYVLFVYAQRRKSSATSPI